MLRPYAFVLQMGPVKTQMAVIRARCDVELVERVDELARQWRMKPSEIVRIAIESYLAERLGTSNPLITNPLRGVNLSSAAQPDHRAVAKAQEIIAVAVESVAARATSTGAPAPPAAPQAPAVGSC